MNLFRSGKSKVLTRFYAKTNNGNSLKLRTMLLPDERQEEFVDLLMKYYVKEENSYKATGILKSSDAINECRKQLNRELFKNELIKIIVCCPDSDKTASDIFGGCVLKLNKKGYSYDDRDLVEAQTEPVKKCRKIEKILDCFVSAANIMTRYNADRYYDIICGVVRTDMRRMGILKELIEASFIMCQMHGVPLIAAWCTTLASEKASIDKGFEPIHEINYKDLGLLLDITFEDHLHTMKLVRKSVEYNKI